MHSARPIARSLDVTIHQALMALFAPDLRRRILIESLELEGQPEIPTDPQRARAFVEGPLRLVVKRRVGEVMSRFLLETIAPAFDGALELPAPTAEELPAFGEDDDEDSRETNVYDRGSLERLRARLREQPDSGPRFRVPDDL